MDGLFHGKPYGKWDDLGVPLFSETSRLVFEFWKVWIWRLKNKWPDQGENQRSFCDTNFFVTRKKPGPDVWLFWQMIDLFQIVVRDSAKKKHTFPFVDWYNVARKFKSPENTAMKVKLNDWNIQLLPLHCKFVVWLPSKPTTCETSLRSQTQTKRLLV